MMFGQRATLAGRTADRLQRQFASGSYSLVANISGPLGNLARYRYWRRRLRHLGSNVTFGVGVQITNPGYVTIGDNCWLDDYVVVLAGPPFDRPYLRFRPNPDFEGRVGEVSIGRNCHISPQVTLQGHGGLTIGNDSGVASGARVYTLSHHYRDLEGRAPADTIFKFSTRSPIEEQSLICSPVVLGSATAVGLNSVVLPGATIGEGSWVGALSMVAGRVPPHVVAVGNPAVVSKTIRES
jgi:acetyltransferase-like isoleucine patch superfamily enzyme